MSAKFLAVYPVVRQHPWTLVDIGKGVVGSIPTLASKISDFFARTKTTGEVPVSL